MSVTGNETKKIGLSSSDFVEMTKRGYFVDKSLFIKDYLDHSSEVTQIMRPGKFGKTLILSMVQTFFEKTEEDNSVYFKNLKIWECGNRYRAEQGRYPVIRLNLKGSSVSGEKEMFEDVKTEIMREYGRHSELSGRLNKFYADEYERIANGTGSYSDYMFSLDFLCERLYEFHGVRPIILIDTDERSVRADAADHDDAMRVFSSFLSAALKDSRCLEFALIMGKARICRLDSQTNNFCLYSATDTRYSQYFGFTEDEVKALLSDFGGSEKYAEVKRWYGGYVFGETEMFNPGSVACYIANGFKARVYLDEAVGKDIVGELLFDSVGERRTVLSTLLGGGSCHCHFDENKTYADQMNDPGKKYSVLFMSGFLKGVEVSQYVLDVSIPNREVRETFKSEIRERLCAAGDVSYGQAIFSAVTGQDAEGFRSAIELYISVGVKRSLYKEEGVCEILMAGILAEADGAYRVMPEERPWIKRPEKVLLPEDGYKEFLPVVVIECERCDKRVNLEARARAVMCRTEEKGYAETIRESGYEDILKIGVAYCGIDVAVKTEYAERP